MDDVERVPLFSGLDQRQLERVARVLSERDCPPGRTVVREGAMDGIGFFIVTDGSAAVPLGPAGRDARAGDSFGELALITRSGRSGSSPSTSPRSSPPSGSAAAGPRPRA